MVRLNAVSACKIATRREELRRRGRGIGGQLQNYRGTAQSTRAWSLGTWNKALHWLHAATVQRHEKCKPAAHNLIKLPPAPPSVCPVELGGELGCRTRTRGGGVLQHNCHDSRRGHPKMRLRVKTACVLVMWLGLSLRV